MLAARRDFSEPLTAAALGTVAAAVALTRSWAPMSGVAGAIVLALFVSWLLGGAHRWITVFLGCAILLPPLPFPIGDSGPHPALFVAAVGVFAGILAISRSRNPKGALPLVLILFTTAVLGSVTLSAIYSGVDIALASLARALLFAIGSYTFLYTMAVPFEPGDDSLRTVRLLFRFATAAAIFACLDFYFQWPTPSGYEPQFIWLGDRILRRAQGLFYEASTLGNFCAFFLIMILVALAGRRNSRIWSRWELGFAGVVFATALMCSYSRASLLSVFCAGTALVLFDRKRVRWLFVSALCVIVAAGFIYLVDPGFGQSYWLRIEYSVINLFGTPADILSGRVPSWIELRDFITQQPWHLILGIGYKTLPYSDFAGRQIIADNTYLDLLVETGVIGLTLFVGLNILIVRAGIRAIRSPNPKAEFLGKWITCFWIGELIQMFSGDLITYWRVLPIYFWVLAAAIRECDGGPSYG